MRIKLDLAFGFTKSIEGDEKKNGLYFKLNKKRIEIRKKFSYETDSFSSTGEKYWEGEKTRGWKEERNGLYRTAFLSLPKDLCLEASETLKTYAEATGVGDMNLDELLDEFDFNFNRVAIASLRYHMDYSVAVCSDETREKYEKIIEGLSNNFSDPTKEELDHFNSCYADDDPLDFINNKKECATCDKIHEDHTKRQEIAEENMTKARYDFIEIMPSLWS